MGKTIIISDISAAKNQGSEKLLLVVTPAVRRISMIFLVKRKSITGFLKQPYVKITATTV